MCTANKNTGVKLLRRHLDTFLALLQDQRALNKHLSVLLPTLMNYWYTFTTGGPGGWPGYAVAYPKPALLFLMTFLTGINKI